MKRRIMRRIAPACVGLLSIFPATTATLEAQTWRWNALTHTPNTPPLTAESTVAVAGGELRMTYTVPLQHRQVVIESCRVAIADVGNASTIVTQGHPYLLVQLKPLHAASCVSGRRPAVALPSDDRQYVARVAEAINRSCCASGRSTPTPSAVAMTSATPVAAPSASPSPAPVPVTSDWVESQGLFSFVRVRNRGREAVTIRAVEIFRCRNVGFGCAPVGRDFTVEPNRAITVATVTSGNASNEPAFAYRYSAVAGDQTVSRTGASGSPPPRRSVLMTAQEIRSAQASALGGLHSPAPDAPASSSPARLVKRGSSRLAIGQTGTALIRLTIAANGTPEEATIVSISNRRLTAAALETAVSSTYAAATQNGKAVAAKYVATFSFDGEDPATAGIPVWKRSPLPGATPSTTIPSAAPEPPAPVESSVTPSLAPPPTPPIPVPSASPIPTPSTAAEPPTPSTSPLP